MGAVESVVLDRRELDLVNHYTCNIAHNCMLEVDTYKYIDDDLSRLMFNPYFLLAKKMKLKDDGLDPELVEHGEIAAKQWWNFNYVKNVKKVEKDSIKKLGVQGNIKFLDHLMILYDYENKLSNASSNSSTEYVVLKCIQYYFRKVCNGWKDCGWLFPVRPERAQLTLRFFEILNDENKNHQEFKHQECSNCWYLTKFQYFKSQLESGVMLDLEFVKLCLRNQLLRAPYMKKGKDGLEFISVDLETNKVLFQEHFKKVMDVWHDYRNSLYCDPNRNSGYLMCGSILGGKMFSVQTIKHKNDGEEIYMVEYDNCTMMVSVSGEARFYKGNFYDFDPECWLQYKEARQSLYIKYNYRDKAERIEEIDEYCKMLYKKEMIFLKYVAGYELNDDELYSKYRLSNKLNPSF